MLGRNREDEIMCSFLQVLFESPFYLILRKSGRETPKRFDYEITIIC